MPARFPSRLPRWCCLPVWCLLALAPAITLAQAPFRFQTFTTRHGLAQDRVTSLLQDRAGFLWIGTNDGLSRFDGISFRNFYHDRHQPAWTLPLNNITDLLQLPDGTLLISTAGGLCAYDARTGTFRPAPRLRAPGSTPTQANMILGMATDASGRLWLATHRALLRSAGSPAALFRPGAALPVVQPTGVRPGSLTSGTTGLGRVATDADGRLWIATLKGINVYDPASASFWNYQHNPRGWAALRDTSAIRTLTLDHQGRIWYVPFNQGLRRFTPRTGELRTWHQDPANPSSLPNDGVNCLHVDRANTLWIGTLESGAGHYDESTDSWQVIRCDPTDPASLPAPQIHDILEDRQGNVWFATDGGLALLSPLARQFTFWQAPGHPVAALSLPASLTGICPDTQGRLWLGTYFQGLLRFDAPTGRFHRVTVEPQDLHNGFNGHDMVWTIAPAPDGRLWVGTQTGLRLFDPISERWLPLPGALDTIAGLGRARYVVAAILNARDGSCWLAPFRRGLVRYNPRTGTIQRFHGPDPRGGDTLTNAIRSLAEDAAGNIWAGGSFGHGLSRLTRSTWRVRTWRPGKDPEAPPDTDAAALLPAPDGGVWIGSSRAGLFYYNPAADRFRQWAKEDGLAGDMVFGLTYDARGSLWISTNNGLSSLASPAGRLTTYRLDDGLPEAIFSTGAHHDPATGTLWLTTDSYLVRIDPARLVRNRTPPPLALTGFQVNGQTRALPAAAVELRPNENTLSFEFAALNLLAPQQNRYTWQLQGADQRWSPPSSQRTVTYANLPPGHYTLRVRAANNSGVWTPRGLTLQLRLLPPWYRTWWFLALLASVAGALLYAFYRQRLARAIAVERARNQIARDLHDEIGSTLSSILIQSRVPASTIEQARTRLQKISDYAEPMLQAMDEIVWAVNPRFDPLPAVIARMRAFAGETLEPLGVRLTFRATGPLDRISLSLQRRREFWLIYKEAIHNAAKYARATAVQVSIAAAPRRLTLEIHDDGIGFNPQEPPRGTGNGLRNQQQRARALNATLTIASSPNQGTHLRLEVPV